MNQDTMAGGLRRVLPLSLRSPSAARRALDALDDDLPSGLLRDTKLLVSELISHRLRREPVNGQALSAGTITLDVSVTDARVHVEVRYDERGSVAPRAEAGEPTLGWQLHMVAELADRWGIERDGLTTVWFELDR
jgi:hypothetical protein